MRKVGAGLVLLLTSCSQTPGAAYREEGGREAPVEHAFNLEALAASTTTTEPEPTTTVAPVIPPPTAPARSLQPVTTTPVGAVLAYGELAAIRACEQGTAGYATNTGNGYYGAYQFSLSTWASVGGTGNPANASPAEQDMRAQMMIDAGRRGEWPNC